LAANNKPANDPTSFTSYGPLGANVSDTPFRLFKHWEYEGGTATPFIAYYPDVIKPGSIVNKPAHIIDLMATCLDLAGATYPKVYQGNNITPTEGISLVPVFKCQKWQGHNGLFFEHEGNRAVRQGDWKLVSQRPENKWELYNISTDRSELNDLSAKYPQKVAELEAMYNAWATHAGVVEFDKLAKAKGE
jgi:arylsulfatase A-like enzyme